MTLKRLTDERLVADIDRRLKLGQTEATAERIKSIAGRPAASVELLRALVLVMADSLITPAKRVAARPKQTLKPDANGVYDLDSMPAKTAREQMTSLRAMVTEYGKCERVYKAHKRNGSNIKAECQRLGIGTSTYYKWFPRGS